jgi:5-methylcytosine-specific restriction endonuclease McrA
MFPEWSPELEATLRAAYHSAPAVPAPGGSQHGGLRAVYELLRQRSQKAQEAANLSLRLELWERDGKICPLCHRSLSRDEVADPSATNLDHIRPRSHGGSNQSWNLQVTHIPCNTRKADTCPGCVHCDESDRHVLWTNQLYRCARCDAMIPPSQISSEKIIVTSKFKNAERHVRYQLGRLYLVHDTCA